MNKQIRCLVVEDDPIDFEILERHLGQYQPAAHCLRVARLAEFDTALEQGVWDVVLCDYNVPGLELQDILNRLQTRPGLPLIVVTGTIGEESAVELLKLGVNDFVFKRNLTRLIPAITRSLAEAATRRERQAAEERHRSLFDNMLNGCAYCRMIYEEGQPSDFVYLEVNQAFETQTGLKQVAGRRVSEVIPGFREADPELFALYARVARTGRAEKTEIEVAALREWFAIAVYQPAVDHFVAVFDVITERKRAEELLRKTQSLYHSLVEQLPVGIYQKDALGRYVVVNPTLCRLRGKTAADFLGKTALEVAQAEVTSPNSALPAAREALVREEHHRQVMQKGQPIEFEESFVLADGRPQFMQVMKLPVLDPAGRIIGTQGVLIDITERKRAEAALLRSEEFKQAILDSVTAHIAVLDETGVILAVNARWQDFARANPRGDGRPAGDIGVGVNYLAKCRNGSSRECPGGLAAKAGIEAVMTGRQEDFAMEYRCDAPGEKRWFSMVVTRLGKAGPQVVVSHTNITERVAAREKIAAEQARFKLIFDSVPIGIAYAIEQPDGQLQRITNAAHLKICGLTADQDAQPGIYLQITHPEDQVRQQALISQLGPNRVGAYGLEKRYLRPDGQLIWCAFSYKRQSRPDGSFEDLTTVVDITERKAAEQALRESELAFRTLAESMPQIVWICNAAGQNVYFNQQWVNYTGLALTESHGDGWNIPFHPEEKQAAWEAWQQARQNGTAYGMECRLRRADGAYRWWLIRGLPLRNAGEEVLKWFGTCTDIDDLKLAETALRASRAKLDAALASMTDAVFISDVNGHFLDFNEAFATFHKYRNKAECARHINDYPALLDIFLPNGEPAPLEMWAVPRALRGETVTNAEYTIRRKDTGETWVCSCSFSPIRDPAGMIVGAVVVGRDITASKQAEQTLRMSQFSMEHCGDAIWWLTPDGRFVRANQAACRLVGYTGEELLAMSAHDLNPEQPPAVWAEHWRELGRKKILTFEAVFRAKDGRPLAVEVTANYIAFEGQEFNCAFVRDITERKTKTEELLWKTAFLEAMVHSAADGILVVDRQNRKILQNQKVLDLWKIPPEISRDGNDGPQWEFIQNQVSDAGHFLAKTQHLLGLPDELARDEVELKDGTVLERHTSLVRGLDGATYGRVWTFHDITKRRQLEAQYRQAQKMEAIGTLAGGIAHDFNNILCAMFGYGYLLQQETGGNPLAQEYLEEILKAASRAKDLVQQILTFSRQREHKREVIRLETVIKEVAKFLRASLPANIQIEVSLDEKAPAVLADPTQIYQVAMNLATNALHAMEGRPGRLLLTLAGVEPDEATLQAYPQLRAIRYTRLTVADTGHGMDARILERIFEPFFTTKPVGKGTGLGLAVVHGILQSHDGVITVTSQPGRGTTFELYFPAQLNAPLPAENALREIPRGAGQRILLLDDEAALTGPFQGLLQRLNYQVTISNLASEAVRRFRETPEQFDLLITDLTMPEMSGLEVARQFHAIRADLPVILMTGYAYSLNEATLREAGIGELLEKPIALAALARAVQRALVKT